MSASPIASDTAVVFGTAARSLAATLTTAVVQVRGEHSGGGAGIVWGPGLVVTNAHCVPRDSSVRVSVENGGRWRDARVIGYHPSNDVALLAVPTLAAETPTLEIRDADSLRAGELLFAHGHPLGLRDAMAMGVLHDVARDRRTGRPRWIVADVRLAPGNSGGPLVDAEGRLVGINSMVVNGLGVAIPAVLARDFVERVLAKRAA